MKLDLQQLKLGHISRRRREGAPPETIIAELIGMGIPEDEAYESVGVVADATQPKKGFDDWWIWLSIPAALAAGGLIFCAVAYGFEATLRGMFAVGIGSACLGLSILYKFIWFRRYELAMPGNHETKAPDYIIYLGFGMTFGGLVLAGLVGMTHPEVLPGLISSGRSVYYE